MTWSNIDMSFHNNNMTSTEMYVLLGVRYVWSSSNHESRYKELMTGIQISITGKDYITMKPSLLYVQYVD